MRPDRRSTENSPPSSSRKKIRWLVGFLAAAAFVWLWGTPMTLVTQESNGEWLASAYRLKEDSFDHPRLALLRSRERLDDVVAAGHSEFDKIVLLRKWAHDQWSYRGDAFYYPAWDAVEILDLARGLGNKGFCA